MRGIIYADLLLGFMVAWLSKMALCVYNTVITT